MTTDEDRAQARAAIETLYRAAMRGIREREDYVRKREDMGIRTPHHAIVSAERIKTRARKWRARVSRRDCTAQTLAAVATEMRATAKEYDVSATTELRQACNSAARKIGAIASRAACKSKQAEEREQ